MAAEDQIDHDFDTELADKTICQSIQQTFEGCDCKDIDQKVLDKWTKSITDNVLKNCAQDNCKCKYACTVTIIQKTGAGFLALNKMHWDVKNVEDGGDCFVKVAWENDAVFVLTTLYAVKVFAAYSADQIRALKAVDVDAGL